MASLPLSSNPDPTGEDLSAGEKITPEEQEELRAKWREKNKKHKLDHRVSNEKKRHFKGGRYKFKTVRIRPRLSGVCEKWSRDLYETREYMDVEELKI